jgi:succinoglycan biosynthesis protein ExoV
MLVVEKIMKYRCYIRWPGNNFGDNLNDIIFKETLGITDTISYGPNIFKIEIGSDVILGLGTILSSRFLPQTSFTVFGSGAKGKSFRLPHANILFVRGRISCDLLGIPHSRAWGDAAYSIHDYIQQHSSTSKKYRIGIIPHLQNINHEIYRNCPDDCCIIDVRDPVCDVINQISQCHMIAAEAMHGAICADILRVPWANIWINDHFRSEKWHDWISAFDQTLELNHINDLSDTKTLSYELTDDARFRACCKTTGDSLRTLMT